MQRTTAWGLGLAAVVIVLDQVTKQIMLNWVVPPPGGLVVLPFFNLVLVGNPGISFGLLAGGGPWGTVGLVALAVAVCAVLGWWLWRAENRLLALSLGAVIGGAVGNVIDRLIHGVVVDFLDFHAWGWHFPAFNVADTAITLGAIGLIWESLFGAGRSGKQEDQTLR